MNNSFYVLILASLFLACKSQPTLEPEALPIIGCWTHSIEENLEDYSSRLFRPCDFKEYPKARFRQYFDFKENGNCSWLHLADNDAHYVKEGKWSYDAKNKQIIVKENNGDLVFEMIVIELDENILKLKYP